MKRRIISKHGSPANHVIKTPQSIIVKHILLTHSQVPKNKGVFGGNVWLIRNIAVLCDEIQINTVCSHARGEAALQSKRSLWQWPIQRADIQRVKDCDSTKHKDKDWNKKCEMNGVTNLRGDSCCEQKGSMWSQSLRTKTDNGQQMRMKKLSFCFLTWMKTCGRLFFLNEWTLSALDYTFNHTSIRLFYTLYSHLPHSQQLFNLNPGVWLWTARTSVRPPALATTWTHLHYSVRIHPKNSLATEFPAVCHGVQSAPNKKSPLNKTGKKGFSCINNNNNNNHNNNKKKKWKRIQMDSLRLEEQFRNCNCGVDDVTHEKLNK